MQLSRLVLPLALRHLRTTPFFRCIYGCLSLLWVACFGQGKRCACLGGAVTQPKHPLCLHLHHNMARARGADALCMQTRHLHQASPDTTCVSCGVWA